MDYIYADIAVIVSVNKELFVVGVDLPRMWSLNIWTTHLNTKVVYGADFKKRYSLTALPILRIWFVKEG